MSRSHKKLLYSKYAYYKTKYKEKRRKNKLCRKAKETHHGSTYKKITKYVCKWYKTTQIKINKDKLMELLDFYIKELGCTPMESKQLILNEYYRK